MPPATLTSAPEGAAQGGDGVFVKSTESGLPLMNDDRTFALLSGSDLQNGSIEVELDGAASPNVSRFFRNLTLTKQNE